MTTQTSPGLESLFAQTFPRSAERFRRAKEVFPNGVTHDGRHLKPFPVYVERALGSRKQTIDGVELIDFWMGHGSLLLGHGYEPVVEAVREQVGLGTHFSACHDREVEWGERVIEMVPSAERVRFTSSGTEATLMAVRIARIATGRSKVLKFAGHFHGWHDQLIPAAESPNANGDWSMPGISGAVQDDLVVVPPNDIEAVERAIEEHQPACVILEPTGGRWGTVPIRGEFHRALRDLTARTGTLLIFDEVITGFRVSPGGTQQEYEIVPDLTTLAKILAGGLPGGCLAGRADLMVFLEYGNASGKKMKHPGTYNANPLSAVAGIAALSAIADGEPCRIANQRSTDLRRKLNELFSEKGVDWVAYGDFSLTKILPEYRGEFPADDDFVPYDNDYHRIDKAIDPDLSHAFRSTLLAHGVDLMGWGAIMSAAHTNEDIDQTVEAFSAAIDLLRQDRWIS